MAPPKSAPAMAEVIMLKIFALFYSEFPVILLHYALNFIQDYSQDHYQNNPVVCTDNTSILRPGHIIIEIRMLTNHLLDYADHFVTFHPCS